MSAISVDEFDDESGLDDSMGASEYSRGLSDFDSSIAEDDDYYMEEEHGRSKTPSTAPTSNPPGPMSVRSVSPAPSIYSLTQSLRENSFVNVHGRFVNSHSDVYQLPADDEEISRLDNQHVMFRTLIGKNIMGPAADVLAPGPGPQKAILDLGTGSGAWVIDMANDFPHCEVVGVDLAPIQTRAHPPNCRVEVDDINLGLDHFYNCFDLVHARLISSGIKDYQSLIDEVSRVLRPGGLISFIEWDFDMYDRNRERLMGVGHTNYAALAEFLDKVGTAARARRGEINAATMLPRWIESHPAYEEVNSGFIWIPTSPFYHADEPDHVRLNHIGMMCRDDVKNFVGGARPLLLEGGMSVDDVTALQEKVYQEQEEAAFPMFIRLAYAYGRKKIVP